MARFRKNESIAAKRRVKVFVYQDDGITPAPAATTFAAVAAHVALTGTHHATFTENTGGAHANGWTISTVSGGSGVGSLTIVGGTAFTFHYQSGVTTMANMVAALALYFTASGYTGTDVLVSAGDTQGPLTLAGGVDYGWEVSLGNSSFQLAIGTATNCLRNLGTGIDGCWQYEFDQSELNFLGAEAQIKLEYPGFKTQIVTCDMNDAADFDSLDEASHTYGDTHRLHSSVLAGKVQNFGSGTLAWRDLADTKTRWTTLTSTLGRIGAIIGDLLP